jgi:REP element-mobilizing transposase RayT
MKEIAMTYDVLRRGRVSMAGAAYHVVLTVEGRIPLFADFWVARVAIREMRRIQEAGFVESLAWVVMPDHLHWLFVLGAEWSLATVMQQYKGASARAINLVRGVRGPLWQRAYYDHAVRKEEDLQDMARYIVGNPLRAGLVADVGDYPHWDVLWGRL